MLESTILYRRGRPGDPDDSRDGLALAITRHRARRRAETLADPRYRVVCLECHCRFRAASALPECPRCGGVDVELA